MNHHRQKVLQSLFAHPLASNIELRDVEHLLTDLGANVEEKGEKFLVTLKDKAMTLHRPHHHTLPKDEVARVRDFLTECGIQPEEAA